MLKQVVLRAAIMFALMVGRMAAYVGDQIMVPPTPILILQQNNRVVTVESRRRPQ